MFGFNDFCNGYRVFDNQICWFLNICNVVSTDTKKDAMITINDDNGGDNAIDDNALVRSGSSKHLFWEWPLVSSDFLIPATFFYQSD